MANQLVKHLALVTESDKVGFRDLAIVAAALQKQVARDLKDIWELDATVDAFGSLDDVPGGYWPMILMDDIGLEGAGGVHEDRNGQPFALITASDNIDDWSLTASHETLEMLVDPFGQRTAEGDSPKTGQGRARFLIEVSDPSEAAEFAYTVNGVLVSDFYTPNFFDPFPSESVRYSFTGAITEPRQVLKGGYLSWQVIDTEIWWQETFFRGSAPSFRELGRLDAANGNIRAQIDRLTGGETKKAVAPGRAKAKKAGHSATANLKGCSKHASKLRDQIAAVVKAFAKK